MAKIPEFIWEPLNSAFPANVALIGTPMPDGFVQISPRGSILVYDDETIAFWSRGHGHTHDNRQNGVLVSQVDVSRRQGADREAEQQAGGALLPRGPHAFTDRELTERQAPNDDRQRLCCGISSEQGHDRHEERQNDDFFKRRAE